MDSRISSVIKYRLSLAFFTYKDYRKTDCTGLRTVTGQSGPNGHRFFDFCFDELRCVFDNKNISIP